MLRCASPQSEQDAACRFGQLLGPVLKGGVKIGAGKMELPKSLAIV